MIYIFAGTIVVALICLMVFCIKILNENLALKTHLKVIEKDYDKLLNENISLIERISNGKN